jgi:CHAT domain-containing protein
LRLTAQADAHYGRAEGVPGLGPTPGADLPAEYRAAAAGYEAAARALGTNTQDPLYPQSLLAAAAVRYQDTSDWQQAAEDATQAREAFHALGDNYGAARAEAILAGADMELGLADRARAGASPQATGDRLADVRGRFMTLAAFHRRRGELFDEALALNNAGLADYYAGQFERGMRAYHQALPIDTRLGENPREAQVLQNIALMEYELGRYHEARRDYARARQVLPPDPNSELPGDILNNQALAEYASGELDQALLHYGEALAMLEQVQVPLQVARSLHGLGIVYYAAGDREQSLQYFTRALAMRNADQDARGRTATLRAMASVLSDLGRPAEAIALRREALSLAVAPSMRVRIGAQLALDLEATGRHEEAIATIEQAMRESQSAPRAYQAIALAARAQLALGQGRLADAERDSAHALSILKGVEAATDEFNTLVIAARVARARGASGAAQSSVARALKLAEEMRLESANPELRAGIWHGVKPAFDLKLDLTEGDSATLAVAESYRARSLSDYWRSSEEGTKRLRTVYDDIADRRSQLELRLDRSGENDPRAKALEADIARLRREADSLHRSRVGGEAASSRTPAGLKAVLARLSETIPSDTAVIEYWLGAGKARAWVITKQGVGSALLGDAAAIDQAARALQQSLRSYSSGDRQRLIATLSRQVIPPQALKYRTLVIIPDGALHYVPFAVLSAPEAVGAQPLIGNHTIVIAPSLRAVFWHRPTLRSARRALIVSDPAYSPGTKFEPLPGTAVESAAIVRFFDAGELDLLSRFEASRTRFLGSNLTGYRVIHIAAHAVTDTQAPLLSALILSTRDSHGAERPGQVFAGELTARSLNAEVVVLSACDTALGREVMGEGLLGLRYAAHAAGAESVVASLWPASERATTELMTSFYSHYEKAREPPAVALAEAMRELRARFADPALWGAFEISAAGSPAMFALDRTQH